MYPAHREDMVEEIKACIESQIQMSRIPVAPGYVEEGNIQGDRTEDKVPGEGVITYDIRLHSWIPDDGKAMAVKLLINIEAQKSFYRKYSMSTRGIFYGARMISAQLNTEFSNSDYNSIKKVYSIWICMNAPKKIGNAMAEYRITKQELIGHIPERKENYDKLSVVMVCLNNKMLMEYGGLHHFLNTLLSSDMKAAQKKMILEEVFDMVLEDEVKEVMNEMCNLSEAIEERAISRGINKGINKGIHKGIDMVVSALIETCKELGVSKEMTVNRVMDKLAVSHKKANEYVNKYWI